MHVCIRQGGAAELHVPEPDEDALEAPAFDHIWTIKVAFPCFLCLSNFLAECHRFSILRGGQPPDHSFAASCSMLIWILSITGAGVGVHVWHKPALLRIFRDDAC